MGYRVEYQPIRKLRRTEKCRVSLPALTALCLLLFVLLVSQMWPQGRSVLWNILLPGDAAITALALDDFSDEIKTGSEISTAFKNFCCTILKASDVAD